jgi:hypothetical protein
MRWWKLAGLAVAGLVTLAAATWAVLWVRPPEPARLIVLLASYDNTLAVPSNPFGKSAADDLASLARPGAWFGSRSRLHGASVPARLTRIGLPDLSSVREKCLVVVLAAHGGRDRHGAFLFPEDATGDLGAAVRVKKVLEELSRLPAARQKLLILDATQPQAYPELGLVNNDFASAVEELNEEIQAIPNLAVFMSTGQDQRSWVSPEWGRSSFLHHVQIGLQGAADANQDKRISGAELVEYVGPRVHGWARDHRAALQMPVLLPRGAEGTRRVAAMHLSMTEGPPPEDTAPTPFDPPAALEEAWREHGELARASVHPTAYSPHLWRQYEAWLLRYEQALIARDTQGAGKARDRSIDLKRQIEAARQLDISPQTLALPAALGGKAFPATLPDSYRTGIEQLAAAAPADRSGLWSRLRNNPDRDADAGRLLWCRALVEWAAADPLSRLSRVPELIPLVSDGLALPPAEVNFLLMLSRHLPHSDKTEVTGPLLKQVLGLRLEAEQCSIPFGEYRVAWSMGHAPSADINRRIAEDLCFATTEADWKEALNRAETARSGYRIASRKAQELRRWLDTWHAAVARLPGLGEWIIQGPGVAPRPGSKPVRDEAFIEMCGQSSRVQALAAVMALPHPPEKSRESLQIWAANVRSLLESSDAQLLEQYRELLRTRPEFDTRPTLRADAVEWWHKADALLTVPASGAVTSTMRADLVREYCRVSRQLQVTGKTRPEHLPEQTADAARQKAFESANRRGHYLLALLGGAEGLQELLPLRPGEGFAELQSRFAWFAFQARGRQTIAEAGSRCSELLEAVQILGARADDLPTADRWIRVAAAHADVSDRLIDRLRRERVRAVLAEQATRTYLDHWYGDGGSRYYRTAIEQLAADAQKLGQGSGNDSFSRYLGSESPFPVQPVTPPRVVVTDQPRPELSVGFQRPSSTGIDGMPVFWTTPAQLKEKVSPRSAISTDEKTSLPTLIRALVRPATPAPAFPRREGESVQVIGFFRGRTLERSVPVDFYRLPDRIAATAPPLKGTAIAVRADPRIRAKYGFGTGAVSIVLDCSGSLGPADRKNPLDRGLYARALKALDVIMHELPPGTILNVWVFGQKLPGAKAAEDTIREVLPPTPLPYDRAAILAQVTRDVAGLDPWDLSPVIRSAMIARDRIKDLPVPFKAVVLISDGIDTRYADDPTNKQQLSVKDAIRAEFPPSGVSLSLVALPADKSETAFQNDFSIVSTLRPPGKVVPVENAREIATWLRGGLNPRVRFTIDEIGGSGSGADLTAGTDNADNWYSGRIEPGTYFFRLTGARDVTREIRIEAGDRLLLDVSEDRDAVSVTRSWFADTAAGIKSGTPTDAWRLNLLQNRSQSGGLRLFAAIEARPKVDHVISVSRIGDLWLDLRAVLPSPVPVSVKWRPARGYPAPCWAIDLPGWPAFPGGTSAASPALEAWWSPDRPFPASGTWKPSERLLTLRGETIKTGDVEWKLEAASIEEHAIDGENEPRKCLVLRIAHPPGQPLWLRPMDVTPERSEVRFYREANRTTCIFWGIDAAQFTGFEVVVLNDALRRSRELGHHAVLDSIPAPTQTSPRPEPPVEPR